MYVLLDNDVTSSLPVTRQSSTNSQSSSRGITFSQSSASLVSQLSSQTSVTQSHGPTTPTSATPMTHKLSTSSMSSHSSTLTSSPLVVPSRSISSTNLMSQNVSSLEMERVRNNLKVVAMVVLQLSCRLVPPFSRSHIQYVGTTYLFI